MSSEILREFVIYTTRLATLILLALVTLIILKTLYIPFFSYGAAAQRGCSAMASSFLMRLLDHTQRRTTVGRTPLDE